MKRIFFLLVLLLPIAAYADAWVEIDNPTGGDHYYYHNEKIAISGNKITYWRKIEFKKLQNVKDQNAKSAMFRERMDCIEHTLSTLDYLLYTPQGAIIEQVNRSDPETLPVIPDTVGDLFEKVLCPLVGQHKQEEKEKTETPLTASAPASAPAAAPTLEKSGVSGTFFP